MLRVELHHHFKILKVCMCIKTDWRNLDHNRNDHYCLIENMPYLIEAYVDVELDDINGLIGSITSVKRLAICSEAMCDEGFVFNQLEHLEVLGISINGVNEALYF
ncbi:unnamed protein product [Brassica rapa]|uniref:FBD domain-containing protein n=2 Tax=Brassica TaxID=3705 RepID=A0A3P5YIE9_BRACM|nr:unnamed protein product [Brassica napus]CAG7865629.1 unnamed protein product [Brassica rapa]CDY40226.1 BnaA09g35080D [Brassica napus]VDC62685.1 unnamed protein product [Brassica rapa]